METIYWFIGIAYIVFIALLVTWLYPLPQYTRRENILISLLVMFMPVPGLPMFFMLHHRLKNPLKTTGSGTDQGLVNATKASVGDIGVTAEADSEFDEFVVMESDSLKATKQQLTDHAGYLGKSGEGVYHDFLLATQSMSDESAVDILKQGMCSNVESTRLLSHAFYSKREDYHFKEIESLIARLRNGQFHNPQLHIALAETYQHMINTGLFGQTVTQEVRKKIKLHASVLLKYEEHRHLVQRLLSQANQPALQAVKSTRSWIPLLTEDS